jgi:peptidoglycan/xylan/chitin deacetylase (PgdA/CDA1 family)
VIDSVTALGLDHLTRSIERRERRRRRAQVVRVLFLHDMPPAHAGRFRRRLSWLRQHFNVIDFATFRRLFESSLVLEDERPAVLLTFDDGLASNYEIAAPMLEEAGMKGVFFVVPRFSACTGDEARRFYLDHVRDKWPALSPMTPQQIRDLSARGHTIGNHTLSHARLSDVPTVEYEREIVESAAIIESWIERPVEAFSWPLAWNAITPAAHRMAYQRHRYCFTPCSGRTDVHTDSPRLIWRTNVETSYTSAEFRFKCSGLADQVSARRRQRLMQTLLGLDLSETVSAGLWLQSLKRKVSPNVARQ